MPGCLHLDKEATSRQVLHRAAPPGYLLHFIILIPAKDFFFVGIDESIIAGLFCEFEYVWIACSVIYGLYRVMFLVSYLVGVVGTFRVGQTVRFLPFSLKRFSL